MRLVQVKGISEDTEATRLAPMFRAAPYRFKPELTEKIIQVSDPDPILVLVLIGHRAIGRDARYDGV